MVYRGELSVRARHRLRCTACLIACATPALAQIQLNVPADVTTRLACNTVSGSAFWVAPSASSSCGGLQYSCSGQYLPTGQPWEAERVMNQNPSYVFFRTLDGEGPLGSQGVVLTPGRSLAVDRTHLALGVPIWLDAEDPLDPNARVRRLMVAQDTGGAIRGPVRGDVFWGHGAEAAERAGRMRSSGRYWLLLPREVGAARLAGR